LAERTSSALPGQDYKVRNGPTNRQRLRYNSYKDSDKNKTEPSGKRRGNASESTRGRTEAVGKAIDADPNRAVGPERKEDSAKRVGRPIASRKQKARP